jgi:tetratricopeptide (TPR) repeat protein
LAAIHRKRGEFDQAKAVVAEAFATEHPTGDEAAGLWLERVWTLGVEGRVKDAIDSAGSGLAALKSLDADLAGELLVRLAQLKMLAGDGDAALEHGERARAIFEGTGNLRGLTRALRVTGGVLSDVGDLDRAADRLREALPLAERIGSAEETAGCLINLGLVEQRRGNTQEGISCDRAAIEVAERVGLVTAMSVAYVNLAEKLVALEEMDEAVTLLEKGRGLAESIGNTWTVADAHRTLALVRFYEQRPVEARNEIELAASLFREIGDEANAASCLALLS